MKHMYIVTGYSKKEDKLVTRTYNEIWPVVDIINKLAGKEIVNEKDLDFEAQSRASHNGAAIVDKDPQHYWSIYYI